MDARELMEWVVFNNTIQPLPDPWLQTGIACAATANFSGNVKKSHFPVTPDAFIPLAKRRKKPVDWRVQKAKMEAFGARFKAMDKKL